MQIGSVNFKLTFIYNYSNRSQISKSLKLYYCSNTVVSTFENVKNKSKTDVLFGGAWFTFETFVSFRRMVVVVQLHSYHQKSQPKPKKYSTLLFGTNSNNPYSKPKLNHT